MVPMRDGVRLAADIYYPARDGVRLEGKFPAILERTPYNKGGRFHGLPGYPWQPYYASRGKSASRRTPVAVETALSTEAAGRGSSQLADFTRRKGGVATGVEPARSSWEGRGAGEGRGERVMKTLLALD